MPAYAAAIPRPPRTLTELKQATLLKVTREHRDGFRDHCIFAVEQDPSDQSAEPATPRVRRCSETLPGGAVKAVDEGTWFALPLRSKGFAAGVVARTSPGGGVVLAYFFKTVWDQPPPLGEVKGFEPADAVRVLRVGDLGLIDGTWPILGRDPDWRRGDWTVPRFVRRDDLSRRAWSVQYSDRDANLVESESPTSYDSNLERDAVLGAGAVEVVLTKLLG